MFGLNLKRIRKSRGLLQSDLAKVLHVSDRTVSSWEVCRTEPSMGMVEQIAAVLRCSTAELLGDVAVVSVEEREMLRKFRALDPTQQDMILASIDAAYVATKKSGGIASAS